MGGLNPLLLRAAFERDLDVKRAFMAAPAAGQADPAMAGGAAPPADPAALGAAPMPPEAGVDPAMAGVDPAAAAAAPPPGPDPAAAGAAAPAEAAPAPPPAAPAPALSAEEVRNIIREEMAAGGSGGAKKPKKQEGDAALHQVTSLLTNLHKSLNIPLPYDILDKPKGEEGGSSGGGSGGGSGGSDKKASLAELFGEPSLEQKIEAAFSLRSLAK